MTQLAPTPPLAHDYGALLRLAGPVVLSQFASNALALIATAVIGRLGEAELAAAAYANATYYLLFMMLLGTILAVSPRVAQAHGATLASGGEQGAGVALALAGGLRLALLMTVLVLPLIWLGSLLLPHLIPAGIRADLVATYLRVYSLSMLPMLAGVALRGVLEGTGRPAQVTLIALCGVGLAGFLSPALAFGWGPLPRLGLVGAASASVVAAWLMAALLWPVAHRRAGPLTAGADVGAETRQIFRLGWPIGLTLGAEGGMFTVSTLLMAKFGPEVLAAHNLTMQAITAIFMIPLGIASATSVRVGHAAGAQDWRSARRAGLVGLSLSVGVMLVFAVIELLAPRSILGVFVNLSDPKNAQMIATATVFLSIAALFQTVDGTQVTLNGALRGLQDTRAPLIVSLIAYWVVGLGLGSAFAFHFGFGARGLWYGLTAGLAFAAAALLWRFLRMTAKRGV